LLPGTRSSRHFDSEHDPAFLKIGLTGRMPWLCGYGPDHSPGRGILDPL